MRTPVTNAPDCYTPTVINGKVQHVRDKATLRADAIALLHAEGPMPATRMAKTLRTTLRSVSAALADAEAAGEVESYLARSSRGRMDEFWCIAGEAPAQSQYKFDGAEILAAFQAAAAHQYSTAKGNA